MNKKVQIFDTKPINFISQVEVAACYIEIDNTLLLLQCGPRKTEFGLWGVPAGKIEPNETPEQAARRELFEETGIQTDLPLYPFQTLYIRKPETDYTFHLFKLNLPSKPPITLSDEHLAYQWAHIHTIDQVQLMVAARELIQKCLEN